MKITIIARRYAEALFEAAKEHNQSEIVNEQLRILVSLLEDNAGFRQFFLDKSLGAEKKQQLIRQVFAPSFSPLVVNFLLLIIEKHREPILFTTITMFEQLWLDYLGILPVKMCTAKTLSASLEKQLATALKKVFHKEIIFQYSVDPSLINGAIIHIGDLMIDGSVKTKLNNIHKQLTK